MREPVRVGPGGILLPGLLLRPVGFSVLTCPFRRRQPRAPSDNAPMTELPDLWSCSRCGAEFTTANQWHSCGVFSLEEHFCRSEPAVRPLYDRLLALAEACGPVTVIPQRSRIVFQVRMRFLALTVQKRGLKGHLILARRAEAPCFSRIESFSPRNHRHEFLLSSEEQLTEEFAELVREAYAVGEQRHVYPTQPPRSDSQSTRESG